MVKLSPRLTAIAQLIDHDSIVADIGTDHGLLPIALVEMKIVKKAYAIDNKSEPLLSAQENIKQSGISAVQTILSDGLTFLPLDCNCLVLAGLGSSTITQILENDKAKLNNIQAIIIQANVGIELVRRWALENSFHIDDELSIKDNDIIYDIIKIKPGYQLLNADELLFGPILLKNVDALFIQKWTVYLEHYQKIRDAIPAHNLKRHYYNDLIDRIYKIIQG